MLAIFGLSLRCYLERPDTGTLVLTYPRVNDAGPGCRKGRAPYRLKAVPRKAGRPKQPENFVRDLVIHNLVDRRIKELGPGTYDASIKDVAKSKRLSESTSAKRIRPLTPNNPPI